MKLNKLITHWKSALTIGAIALLFCTFNEWAQAGTTLVFADNATPINPYPSTNPADTIPFNPGTEFRVILNGLVSGGGMKSVISATAPFQTWIFDNGGVWTVAQNTATTPGATIPTNGGVSSAAPLGATGMALNAPFLGSPFGFLAPIAGSLAAAAYGNSLLTFTSDMGFNIHLGCTEAQWSSGTFTIGLTQGGVNFVGTLQPDKHNFRILSETVIQPAEDSLGFAGQNTQWDLVGSLNSDPVPNITAYNADPVTSLNIPVTSIATDRQGDTLSISTPSPAVSGTAGGTVSCTTTGCVYMPAGTSGQDTFTVTVNDSYTAIPGSSNIKVTINVTNEPVANDDTATVDENTSNNIIDVLANDTAPSGATLNPDSIVIVSNPNSGSVKIPNDGSGTVLYTPNSGFAGFDSFTYTVEDNHGATSNVATVNITVNCASDICAEAAGPVTPGPGFSSIRLTITDLTNAGIGPDNGVDGVATSCDPDCFSFVAPATAGRAVVVLPLSGPLQANSKYRKVAGATGTNQDWKAFVTNDQNKVESAPGILGSCPPPQDPPLPAAPFYQTGLLAGNFCVRLTIGDNQANDDDSVTGQVTDPGGTGVGTAQPVVLSGEKLSSNPVFGCSISRNPRATSTNHSDLWLLAGFLALLAWRRNRNAHR
jgi:hypothetical protein